LKAAGYKLPNQVFVHGHLTVNGEKMSKSKGTSITARTYLNHLSPDYMRYYYACKLTGSVNDLDLNIDDFVNRVNSDLVGKITNLGSRGATMLKKRMNGHLGNMTDGDLKLVQRSQARAEKIAQHFEARDYAKAITEIREIADDANKYFDEAQPWNMIKNEEEQDAVRGILTATLNVFRLLAIYLKPVLPKYSDKVAKLMGEQAYSWDDSQKVKDSGVIGDYEHLATRVELAKFQQIIEDSKPPETKKGTPVATSTPAIPKAAAPAPTTGAPGEIEIDDFTKVDLRIAKIIEAEAVPEADKLLRLKVSLGEMGERQIFAGIKAAYKAEDLVGRLTIVVANLKPRKMKFGMSEGMVLAAGGGGSDLYILSPDSGAQPGQRVK
jgi:methionyl-tRNA synthetase